MKEILFGLMAVLSLGLVAPQRRETKQPLPEIIQFPKRKKLFWRKEFIKRGTRIDMILRVLSATLIAILVAAHLPRFWGWYPVYGRSMQPTLPMIGGYYHFENLSDPVNQLRINDIVILNGPTLSRSIKRIAGIDCDKGLYVLGDNTDKSMDSSFGITSPAQATPVNGDEKVYIPFDEIEGRATDIWSPMRAWRSLTIKGRWGNWRDLLFSRRDIIDGPGEMFIACRPEHFFVFNSYRKLADIKGEGPTWQTGRVIQFYRDDEVWQWQEGKLYKIRDGISSTQLLSYSPNAWKSELTFFPALNSCWGLKGKVENKINLGEATITVKGIKYKITNYWYRNERLGYQMGGVTVVETKPPLPQGGPLDRIQCLINIS